jgi:hypothetical protein
VGGRQPTELAGFSEVQDEAVAFGRSILKHRFAFGIDDLEPRAMRVSNELGRVLAVVPLTRIKEFGPVLKSRHSDSLASSAHDPIVKTSRTRLASSALR